MTMSMLLIGGKGKPRNSLLSFGTDKSARSFLLLFSVISILLSITLLSWAFVWWCGGADGMLAMLDQWIWETSSKERTFDAEDDPTQVWRECFREHAATIHAEFRSFEHNRSISRLVGDYGGGKGSTHPEKWHTIPLKIWNAESPEALDLFPVTAHCLHQSPLVTLLFSVLDPWSDLYPHMGCSYTILRYHLNLELPGYTERDRSLPLYGTKECSVHKKVGKGKSEPGDTCFQAPVHMGIWDKDTEYVKYYEWKQYDDLLFDDMHAHFVQNQTPQRRVVLWGDAPRHDVPWQVRITIELAHLLLPPFLPQVQMTIDHTRARLQKFAGLETHFVRGHVGRSLEAALAIVGAVLALGFRVRRTTPQLFVMARSLLKHSRHRGWLTIKE